MRMSNCSIRASAFFDRVEPQGEPAGVVVAAVEVEDEVLPHPERADVAVVGAVLGDVADAVVEALARTVLADVAALEEDLAGVGLDQSQQRLDQLGLAVALDAGDPEDLAGAGLEGDVLDDLVAARVDDGDVADVEDGVADLAARACRRPASPRGRPSSRPARPRTRWAAARADDLAAADDRDPVADGDDLAELVGDEDDRGALRP